MKFLLLRPSRLLFDLFRRLIKVLLHSLTNQESCSSINFRKLQTGRSAVCLKLTFNLECTRAMEAVLTVDYGVAWFLCCVREETPKALFEFLTHA